MMGLTLWILAGVLSFLLTRFLETHRQQWRTELLVSMASSLLAGVVATALDFGGWALADGRSFAFSGIVSFLCIGILRIRRARRDSQRVPARSPGGKGGTE